MKFVGNLLLTYTKKQQLMETLKTLSISLRALEIFKSLCLIKHSVKTIVKKENDLLKI